MQAKKFGLYEGIKKKAPTTYNELFKMPIKDKGKNVTHYDYQIDDGQVSQADLLVLPTDKGFKYALVVVDIGSRKMDAEPIKKKDAATVLKAFKDIYARKIIKMPKTFLQVDGGTEFKSVVSKYFEDNNVIVRIGRPDRHKQQAVVESKNNTLAKGLFKTMYEIEIDTGEANTQWIDNLPELVALINLNSAKPNKRKPATSPSCEGKTCELIPIGTKVRVILDSPREYLTGQKLHGKFRSTDPRFSTSIHEIEQILLRPNNPPQYLVSGIKYTAYTYNELLITK